MTASSATATVLQAHEGLQARAGLRARTGGPKEDGPKLLEHLLGWTLVVVLAMLVTRTGLM
ncbi:SCO1431 family membrane protein [Streptomyces sp. AN091965]|uniref:SCO1431 family membrane protein n=1 Tax=Streptomyces sp. AN091965 TaxID=2927803 RepID=UPI001F602DD0|nr:SCO1431 family membrane protein [Streptomyces sp. AN091965]MCI3929315.1 SCO1431 family membrane protein [Streptomyces sp. AN091965]